MVVYKKKIQMALIRTTQEAKAAIPRTLSNLSNAGTLPDYGAAEIKYLVPLIGYSQYDQVNGKINADPVEELTEAEAALLPYLRRVSAFFGHIDDLGSDNAKITDSGIRSTESANMPRVYGWQFNELRNTLLSKAYDAIEVMLRFLHENKAQYPSWTSSDEYVAFNSLIIKTGTDFDAHYKLWQPLRSYYSLKILIDEVQEDFLSPALGAGLLAYFIAAENLTENEKKLLKLLKKATAYKTIKKATEHYSVRFDAHGFTILGSGNNENTETAGRTDADLALFENMITASERDAGTYITKAKKQIYEFRQISDIDAFNQAFDAGPLVDWTDPADRTRGNENRKGFRF
jgi:hypothetical protein